MKSKSLAETHPEIAKQWHPTKNGDLSPKDFTTGMGKKVWWKCDKGEDHEWEMSIASRASSGQGCTICRGFKVVKSNCLATLNPDLSKEWHPILNGNLTPYNVIPGTSKKVWWKCGKGEDHEWQASIKNRNRGAGCGVCAGKIIVLSNCLKTLYPKISNQWHLIKNKDLHPNQFTAGSHKKVWWKCNKGDDHEWKSAIGDRTGRNRGCPVCSGHKVVASNCLQTTHSKLCEEWDYSKNKVITPKNIIAGSSKKVWWKCDKGDDHRWEAAPYTRTSHKSGCPVCTNQIVVKSNCLKTVYPELAKEWHPTKNKLTTLDVSSKSTLKAWWICDKGDDHEWRTRVTARVDGNGCPVCSGRKLGKSNSLAFVSPETSQLWHPTLNDKLNPELIIANSHKKVWWKCPEGDDHIWKTKPNILIQNRKNSSSNGCPICRGLKVVKSNSLKFLKPNISSEWHLEYNTKRPENYTVHSGKKVWWKCKNDSEHVWKAVISNRTNGSDCPFCDLTPQSKQELTITFELIKFFKDINPKGFKTRVKGKLWSIDIYIPQLKLGIEFDGSYWHKDKRALDKLKTENLEEEGFEIFRVREEPLKRIFEDDIMSKQPFNAKQLTNDILTQIMSRYTLDAKKINKIKSYIQLSDLQNEKGLDKYIDKILTEKADKN